MNSPKRLVVRNVDIILLQRYIFQKQTKMFITVFYQFYLDNSFRIFMS